MGLGRVGPFRPLGPRSARQPRTPNGGESESEHSKRDSTGPGSPCQPCLPPGGARCGGPVAHGTWMQDPPCPRRATPCPGPGRGEAGWGAERGATGWLRGPSGARRSGAGRGWVGGWPGQVVDQPPSSQAFRTGRGTEGGGGGVFLDRLSQGVQVAPRWAGHVVAQVTPLHPPGRGGSPGNTFTSPRYAPVSLCNFRAIIPLPAGRGGLAWSALLLFFPCWVRCRRGELQPGYSPIMSALPDDERCDLACSALQ